MLETLFPGLQESEKAAVAARTRLEDGRAARLFVRGGGLNPNTSMHFCERCTPVPGDRIVGIDEPDRGRVTVHAIDCPILAEFEEQESLWRDLQWTPEAEQHTITQVKVTATIGDAPGVLGQVLRTKSDSFVIIDFEGGY